MILNEGKEPISERRRHLDGAGETNRFTRYFPLLLDALRSTDAAAMRPAEAAAWIRARVDVPEDDLTRLVVNGKQSIFENDIRRARFYLVKAGLIGKSMLVRGCNLGQRRSDAPVYR